jgi:hypothetical protein
MGALKNAGINVESESFVNSFINMTSEMIESAASPSFPFIELSFGFDVELPKGEDAAQQAKLFKQEALKPDSEFKNSFIPAFKSIFDLLDSIPAVNVLQAIGITDPTAALLPISNIITELLATVGIPDPNKVLLTKLDAIIEKQGSLLKQVKEIAEGSEQQISNAIIKLSEDLKEIVPEVPLPELQAGITANIEKIKALFNIDIPELEIPSITDFVEFFGITIPALPDLPVLPSIDDIISMYFDFDLEIPPIGAMFVEILKVKLKILTEVALAATPVAILNPPDFLKAAIEELKKILTGQFSIQSFLREIARSFFAKFFIELEATKVKNIIEKAPTLVSVLHGMIKVLVGSLVTLVVGILLGEGFIMKTAAIGLGIIS